MTTSVPLTPAAIAKISTGFSSSPGAINALANDAAASPYLAGLLNQFAADNYSISLASGGGTHANSDGKGITIDTNTLPDSQTGGAESAATFGTELGHELSHVLSPGGMTTDQTTESAAVTNGRNSEGVALGGEFIVATQLGTEMYSDENSNGPLIAPTLAADAAAANFNVANATFNSVAANSFLAVGSAANTAGGNWSGTQTPGTAPLLTYDQYNGDWWAVNHCLKTTENFDPATINWGLVTQANFVIDTYPSNCVIDTGALTLNDGGTMHITGEIANTGALVNVKQAVQDTIGNFNTTINTDSSGKVSVEISGSGDNYVGNNQNVTLDAGSTATLAGIGDKLTASNDAFTITGASSNFQVTGSSNNISVVGAADQVQASNSTISDNIAGYHYASIIGGNDVLNINGGSEINLSGSSNTLNLGQNGGASTLDVATGTNNIVNGSASTIDISGAGTSLTLDGTASNLISTSSSIIFASNTNIHLGNGSEIIGSNDELWGGTMLLGDGDQNMTIEGASTVWASYGSATFVGGGTLSGYNETATLSNASETFIVGGKEDVVNASNDTVIPEANTQLDVNGTADQVDVKYSGLGITTSGSTIALMGSRLTNDDFYATGSTFTQSGASDSFEIAGSGDSGTLSGDGIGWLGAETNDTVSDSGGSSTDTTGLGSYGTYEAPVAPIYSSDGTTATTSTNFIGDDSGFTAYDSSGGSNEEDSPDGDPVILNLKGAAVQTQSLATSTVYFDEQNNGNQVHTGWGTAGEGYLVYDPDNLNVIVNGQSFVSSFAALSALDSNNDGVLNSLDVAWAQMKVWVDPTGTGNISGGSLVTLSSLGISSINLHSSHVNTVNNGNKVLDDSTFTWATGGTGDIAGVEFAFDPTAVGGREHIPTRPTGPVTH